MNEGRRLRDAPTSNLFFPPEGGKNRLRYMMSGAEGALHSKKLHAGRRLSQRPFFLKIPRFTRNCHFVVIPVVGGFLFCGLGISCHPFLIDRGRGFASAPI